MDNKKYLNAALEFTDIARKRVLELWNKADFAVEIKADSTPVSDVDKEIEEIARDWFGKRFPEFGFLGEEFGELNPGSEYRWVIDPIDGTQNLINRIPTFGIILALQQNKKSVVGVMDHPVLNERVWGAKGEGVYHNNTPVKISDLDTGRLGPVDILGLNNIAVFSRGGFGPVFHALAEFHPHTRIYYDCYALTLTVLGSLSVTVEFNLATWDLAAVEILVEEAGGHYAVLGRERTSTGKEVSHACFGKPEAVKLVCDFLKKEFALTPLT